MKSKKPKRSCILGLKLFERIILSCLRCSSFCSLTSFLLPARLVFTLDDLLPIKFYFSPFRVGVTNSSLPLRRFLLRSTSLKLLTLSGTSLFSTNLFRLGLLVGLNLSFMMGALAWFFKSRFVQVRRGVSQKFVLGTVLFFNDLPTLPSSASCSLHADDNLAI